MRLSKSFPFFILVAVFLFHTVTTFAYVSETPRQGVVSIFEELTPGSNSLEPASNAELQTAGNAPPRQSILFNRNRQYNPRYGRFLSADPLGFNGGMNLFAYANNNPVLYNDPFGELSQWVIPAGGLVIWGLLETGALMAKIKKECNSLQPGTGKKWSLPPALGILAGPTIGLLQYRPTVEEKEVLFKPEECFNPEHRFGFPAGNCYYQIIYTEEKLPTGEPPKPIPGQF